MEFYRNWGPENVAAFATFQPQPGHNQASTGIVVKSNFSPGFTSSLKVHLPPSSPPPSSSPPSKFISLQVHLLQVQFPPSSPPAEKCNPAMVRREVPRNTELGGLHTSVTQPVLYLHCIWHNTKVHPDNLVGPFTPQSSLKAFAGNVKSKSDSFDATAPRRK